MPRPRCDWCGVFVPSTFPLTRWRSKDADGVWHSHEKTLCPDCRKSAQTEMPWSKPCT